MTQSREEPVGLVHDYLLVMRGAERTFAVIADAWPAAPIYTLLHDEATTAQRFAGHQIETSHLQRLGTRQHGFRRLLPLLPIAASRLPVQEHDVVISSSSAFAHGVRPAAGSVHVCYCHSPFRYAWHEQRRALDEAPRYARPLVRALMAGVRRWDVAASARVSRYIANSQITRERIERFYSRDAPIVHPPVDVDRFQAGTPEDFFLVVCEIVRHKRVDVALEAARRARVRLKIAGDGPERPRLEALYGDTAEFVGRVTDAELEDLYARARAAVMPNVEEFGIAGVEAQAAGRPVIGVAAGGARETVVDGVTGVLVPPGDVDELAEAMRSVDFDRFSSEQIRDNALRFSPDRFAQRMREEVERAVSEHQG